jgi:hypothetical protein
MYKVNAATHQEQLKSARGARGVKRLHHVVRAASLYGIDAVDSSQDKADLVTRLARSDSQASAASESSHLTFLKTYDPSKILSFWAFVMLPDLTVFHSAGHLIATLLWTGITIFMINLPNLVSEETKARLEESCLYNPNMNMQSLLASPTRTLLAFVLGGFVIQVVTAWYRRRKNLSMFYASLRTLIVVVGAAVQPKANGSEEELQTVTDAMGTLGRWIVLGGELTLCMNRGTKPDEARQQMGALLLIKGDEWEHICAAGHFQNTVWYWVAGLMQRLVNHGYLSAQGQRGCNVALANARDQSNDLMGCLARDLPYPYAQMVRLMIMVYLSAQCVAMVSVGYKFVESPSWQIAVAVSIILQCFMLYGLLQMHALLHNPFGRRRIDVPHDMAMNGIKKLADHVLIGSLSDPGRGANPDTMMPRYPEPK